MMTDLSNLSREDKIEFLNLLEEKLLRQKRNLLKTYFPDDGPLSITYYSKHREFFTAGKDYKQRIFSAGNRTGKTTAAAYELVCHLTGNYPVWWQGKRFSTNNSWYVCGKDAKTVKAILQDLLLGPVGEYGTGMIPYDSLDFDTLKDVKKADGAISNVRVKHISGTFSDITFKQYESGRQAFEGVAKNVWADEECPLDVYTELLLRTMTRDTAGDDRILMITSTPLKGLSEMLLNFFEMSEFKTGPIGSYKYSVMCSWDDVPHLSKADVEALWNSIPPFQRDARSKGIPSLGAGVIYPVPMSEYVIDPFIIPDEWPRYGGFDVGWNKTAGTFLAIDPNTNISYLYDEYYRGQAEPAVHATSMKQRGNWIPIAIDSAAHGRSQVDGQNLFDLYRENGLTIVNADKAVETGLALGWELLSAGQIKVFSSCKNFLNEIQIYRRDEKGNVVKSNDHLMDAFRYALMTTRNNSKLNPRYTQKQNDMYYGGVTNKKFRI